MVPRQANRSLFNLTGKEVKTFISCPHLGEPLPNLLFNPARKFPVVLARTGNQSISLASNGFDKEYGQFPFPNMQQLYRVPAKGGRIERIISLPVNNVSVNQTDNLFLYHDYKGYEDAWRKHHTSSIARDIWIYNKKERKTRKLSSFKGENREPVFSPDEQDVYYLSEQSGDFNIWKMSLQHPDTTIQITFHAKNPVRSISIAVDGTLCYSFDGEIYTIREGEKARKINISILTDQVESREILKNFTTGAQEIAVSPKGKEIAFIQRGDLFVTSVELFNHPLYNEHALPREANRFQPGRTFHCLCRRERWHLEYFLFHANQSQGQRIHVCHELGRETTHPFKRGSLFPTPVFSGWEIHRLHREPYHTESTELANKQIHYHTRREVQLFLR